MPTTRLPIPDRALLEPAIAIASPSTVKIKGSACGLATAGSGVAVAAHLVLTAAHVVAGSTELQVIDSAGQHQGIAIIVDPLSDIAVLFVEALDAAPLGMNEAPVRRGTTGVVLGFPHAGRLEASPAVVLDSYRAQGHDIYGLEAITRQILEVQARIVPGSSGGPLVDSQGSLIGMAFGQSEDEPDVGYTLTASAVSDVVDEALHLTREAPVPVSTGACLAVDANGGS